MMYDLNRFIPDNKRIDRFTIAKIPYELGPISEKYAKLILAIDFRSDVIIAWRPVVEGLMDEWNQTSPPMTDTNIGAIIPLIIKRLHEDHSHIQV